MSADVTVVEPHGGPIATPPARRARVLVALLVAVVLVAGAALLWRGQSTPAIVPGSQMGPNVGAESVPDTDPMADPGSLVWRQTAPDAWVAWTVRNDGAHDVALSSGIRPSLGPNVMPREHLSFLAAPPEGGTPAGLSGSGAPTGLVDQLTLAPGAEGFLVLHVFFPAQCLAVGTSAADVGVTSLFTRVAVDADVLGRTTTIQVTLPQRLDVPARRGNYCPLDAFGGQ